MQLVDHINAYLVDAPDVSIENRGSALCDVPRITKGNYPTDGGNLILSEDEKKIYCNQINQLKIAFVDMLAPKTLSITM